MSAYGTTETFGRARRNALGFRPRRMPVSGKGGCGHWPADAARGQGVGVAVRDSSAGRALALLFHFAGTLSPYPRLVTPLLPAHYSLCNNYYE